MLKIPGLGQALKVIHTFNPGSIGGQILNSRPARATLSQETSKNPNKTTKTATQNTKTFADDMIVYLSDAKSSTRELINLINTFSNVAGYKIYSNKSVAFL